METPQKQSLCPVCGGVGNYTAMVAAVDAVMKLEPHWTTGTFAAVGQLTRIALNSRQRSEDLHKVVVALYTELLGGAPTAEMVEELVRKYVRSS